MKKSNIMLLMGVSMILLSSGCASIVGDTNKSITFRTNADPATVEIKSDDGRVVYKGDTPTTLSLKTYAGFLKGEEYRVLATKKGYAEGRATLDSTVNPWFFGNILFFPGFIIDPATGAMWTFGEDEVLVNLSKE